MFKLKKQDLIRKIVYLCEFLVFATLFLFIFFSISALCLAGNPSEVPTLFEEINTKEVVFSKIITKISTL